MGVRVHELPITSEKIHRALHPERYAQEEKPAAPPKGKKASEVLMIALRNLRSYPHYAGADVHSIHFNEAEKAMVTLIGEYRKNAEPERVKYFYDRIRVIARNYWF